MNNDPAHSVTDEFDWDDGVATLGDRLARAREAAGMSQSQLARRLGVRLTTLCNWEDDRSEPRANRMQMLSGLLNVSFAWLMTGTVPEGATIQPAERTESLPDILAELRELRLAQTRIAERTGQLEKRLRNALADE